MQVLLLTLNNRSNPLSFFRYPVDRRRARYKRRVLDGFWDSYSHHIPPMVTNSSYDTSRNSGATRSETELFPFLEAGTGDVDNCARLLEAI